MPSIHLKVGNVLTGIAIGLLVVSGALSAVGVADYPGLPRGLLSRVPRFTREQSHPTPPAGPAAMRAVGPRVLKTLAAPAPAPPGPFWPTTLPEPTGRCPELVDGSLTFAPAGMKARSVRVWISPGAAAVRDGPLVFYWHAAGGEPNEAVYGLSGAVIDAVTEAGGLVAAVYSDVEAGTLPWFLSAEGPSGREDDLRIADEVVGCAARTVGLDVRRIHTVGLGAGGYQSAQMSYRRSNYVASAVTYSGGFDEKLGPPALQTPANLFAALVFHGDPAGKARRASEAYWSDLTAHRHFAAVCRHAGGESVPAETRNGAWEFLQEHPYGEAPSPWEQGLPASLPGSCTPTPEPEPPKQAPASA